MAASILVGFPQLVEDEIDQMIELNASAYRKARAGDITGLRAVLAPAYESMRADPLAGMAAVMEHAPETDQAVMADPLWQAMFSLAVREALAPGIDGWIDETLILDGDWHDIDLAAIRASLTWWHGTTDRNCPLSAVRRLVDRMPTATLREMGEVGHFEPYLREREILDELLNRG